MKKGVKKAVGSGISTLVLASTRPLAAPFAARQASLPAVPAAQADPSPPLGQILGPRPSGQISGLGPSGQAPRLQAPGFSSLSTRTEGHGLFVTGTDTEVGKTALACALAWALSRRGIDVGVMKPVATGCLPVDGREGTLVSLDAQALIKAAGVRDPIDWVCPYRFEPPVAPWVALRWAHSSPGKGGQPTFGKGEQSPSETVPIPPVPVSPSAIALDTIEEAYRRLASRHRWMLVEGIGGLMVPIDERHTVADLAKRLKLPLLVVARAGLGTINHTLLTLEAARNTGLEAIGIVLNGASRRPTLAERTNPEVLKRLTGLPVFGVIPQLSRPVPSRVAQHLNVEEILKAVEAHFTRSRSFGRRLTRIDCGRLLGGTIRNASHFNRWLARIDRKRIWHPFTQMSEWVRQEPLIVESGDGVYLTDTEGHRYLDGVSSLWVNLHGHRRPELDYALRRQIDRIAHSTLLGCANVPSIELAEELVCIAPPGLTRVFYSDNGSTAVEVALKMAFQYWQQNGFQKRRRFVHFVHAYHGDTLGVVSVGGIDLFHRIYKPLLFKGFKLPAPYPYRGISGEDSLRALWETLGKHSREIAAVVVEPVIQAAAGMIAQPPGWLKGVERLCRRYDVFLIADEVAVGFGRTGKMFACEWENVRPDLLCLAKGLSGGYLPLAATLTTEKIYRGFLGSYASQRAFFHGHSYTGNPLACAVALENLRLFRRERILQRLKPKIRLFAQELEAFEALAHVGEVRQRGLIAGIELVADKSTRRPYPWEAKMGIRVCLALREKGILLRPLGNVIVLLPPLSIAREELQFLCRQTYEAIQAVTGSFRP